MNNFDNHINKDGATRKFYPGDSLQLWHEELEPVSSLLDIVSASSPDPQWSVETGVCPINMFEAVKFCYSGSLFFTLPFVLLPYHVLDLIFAPSFYRILQ